MPVKKRGRESKLANDADDYDIDQDFVVSDGDDAPKSKKAKAVKPSTGVKATNGTAESNEQFWELSRGKNSRRVGISEFKGTRLINIREYYQNATGDFLPGKKGISLSLEQYKAFLQALPKINDSLIAMGETIERSAVDSLPEGEEAPKNANSRAKPDTKPKPRVKERKSNIDATSDEEEDQE